MRQLEGSAGAAWGEAAPVRWAGVHCGHGGPLYDLAILRHDAFMDSEHAEAQYEGQIEVRPVGHVGHAVTLDAELQVTVTEVATFGSVLPPLREWGGDATLVDRADGVELVYDRYEVVLPSGDRGEAWVTWEATQPDGDEREVSVSVQGIGRPPWWPAE